MTAPESEWKTYDTYMDIWSKSRRHSRNWDDGGVLSKSPNEVDLH